MKRKTQNRFIHILLLKIAIVLIFISCEGIFSKDKNEIIRKDIALNRFNHIKIYGIYDVILIQDTVHKLTIEGAEDVVADIEAWVDNDTLIIRDMHKNLFRIEERPTLYLHFADITYLCTFNPAKVTNVDTLRLDWFYFYPIGEIGEAQLTVKCNFFGMDNSANTLGRFYIRGMTQTARFYNRYGSSIYADSLISRVVYVFNESVGAVYVNVGEELKVYVWGPGNIYYSGDPDVQIVERRNTGQVLKLN
jgi:hypothetical protein